MQDADVSTIVPSTRDLLQVIGTRRRNLALLGLLGAERPADEAVRLSDLNVSALAFLEPGPAMEAASRATRTVPTLCLGPAGEREHCLSARQHGADGVCIDALLARGTWDQVARTARSMRMLSVALATDAAGLEAAMKAGTRAVLIRAGSAAAVVELAGRAPRGLTLIGMVDDADDGAIRALAGKVDAAVVPPSVHTAASFADIVAEVDP